jgi:hypothetical protein
MLPRRFAVAIVGLAAVMMGCAADASPPTPATSSSWEEPPAVSQHTYPASGSADAPTTLVVGEPVTIDGFLYEVADLRRSDRSTADDGWCLAVQIHEETPDADATDPLVGWMVRDGADGSYFFDFVCDDGTATPGPPLELEADELQPGMIEGSRYWIIFDLPDEPNDLWLTRSREVDGDPVIALQVS